jgi:CheY-like chemotaxis protein
VTLELDSSHAARAKFLVTDQGIGISPEQVRKIFTPFLQAEASIARRYGGTGLGLAISQHLVRAMGGEIEVHSALGAGSCFYFSIDAPGAEPPPAAEPLAPPAAAPGQENLAALVVDDNQVNQIVAVAMLERLGITCTCADSGAAAIELHAQGQFDIVLMDIELGDMDGLEVTRQIRRQRNGHAPHVAAVTAHVLGDIREQCLQAGMDSFLSKPLSAGEVDAWLAGVRQAAQRQRQAPAT